MAAQTPNLSPLPKPGVYSASSFRVEAGSRRTVRRGEIGRMGSRPRSGRCRVAWRLKRAPLPARSCPESNLRNGPRAQSDASGAVRWAGPKILVGRRGESLTHTCGLTAPGPSPRRPASTASPREARAKPGAWPPGASARRSFLIPRHSSVALMAFSPCMSPPETCVACGDRLRSPDCRPAIRA